MREIRDAKWAGGEAEGWTAYPINADSPAPVPWDVESLAFYLRNGWHADHGVSRGPMAEVTGNLGRLPDEDVLAIATYTADVMGEPAPERVQAAEAARAAAAEVHAAGSSADSQAIPVAATAEDRGALVYASACASCHESGRPQPYGGLSFHLSTAVNAPSPQNIVNVTLFGLPPADGEASSVMPAFAGVLSDADMVALLGYLRETFSDRPAWEGAGGDGARHPQRCASRDGAPDRRHRTGARQPGRGGAAMATRLMVNGQDTEIDSDPQTPLLYVLRDELGLNGAKYGCGLGQCGSCTVMVDGAAVLSCLTPVALIEGRAVTTVEGLGTIDDPGPMQRAFIAEQAAQCGYCIPGMMMRAQALLQANPTADEAAIRQALEYNLCRCGTHMRILRAIRRARDEMSQAALAASGGRAMNAFLTRRGFLATGASGLVVSFALGGFAAAQQAPEAEELPGSLADAPHARFLDPHRPGGRDHRLHRQGGARPGPPHRPRHGGGRGARRRARGDRADHRRHRPDPRRRLHRRQQLDGRERHRRPLRRRQRAPAPARRGGAALDRERGRPAGREQAGGRGRRANARLRRARRRHEPEDPGARRTCR